MSTIKSFYKNIKNKFSDDSLFKGDDFLFKAILSSSKKYAEYGCGTSTIWVANNTEATIHSVDTSKEWIDFCKKNITPGRANLEWIDCGPLKKWGRPTSYDLRENFIKYAKSLWINSESADTVLIDGRFRVLCFLNTIKYSNQGTRVIFDDYINRPHYHLIEELVSKSEICGRQCLFIVPEKTQIDLAHVDYLIEKFEYIMD